MTATIAVFVSLLLRNLLFWVMMILSPAFIFLAPLPYARKKLIPAWGSMIYGTILWGPVIYILLMVSNLMIGKMTDIAVGVYSTSPLMDIFINCFGSVLLVISMILAPFLVLQITQGSFGAFTASLGAISTTIAAAGGSAAIVSGSASMWSAGFLMHHGGKYLSKGGNALTQRGYPSIGNTAKYVGSKFENTGAYVTKTGKSGAAYGTRLVKQSTNLHKILPWKNKSHHDQGKFGHREV